jgi:hypothetical protein
METTIQISKELLERLKMRKFSEKESYEKVIWDLIEDGMELSEETKRNIAQADKEFKEGKTHRWEDIKKRLKLNV